MSVALRLHNEILDLEFARGQLACQAAILSRCARDLRMVSPRHSLLSMLDRCAAHVSLWCEEADEMLDELRAELDAIEDAHVAACRERYWLNVDN